MIFAEPGTPIFYVPIRYWEVQEPETGHMVDVGDEGREIHANDPNFIYAFHDGYGHNVYLDAKRAFLTHDEAVTEAHRLKAEYEEKAEAEFQVVFAKIMADLKAKRA